MNMVISHGFVRANLCVAPCMNTGLGMKEMKLIWNVSEQQVNEC
ncbi:hypothetical protein ACI8B_60006 [Acinetobacter proteolyticus]|uniref:Uncharacterized protein n=1 Tax=Acinetobacter proteolyticus TaxID=1776741 RepID=A0A653KAY4_9GAMM|nr:hypothetical protein ACI8B_60006 [Acinetobacter proteolyticus]